MPEANQPEQSLNKDLLAAAVYDNSFKRCAPFIRSTGFRTNELNHRTTGYEGHFRLAETFLVNTRLEPNNREVEVSIDGYFGDPGVVMLSMNGQTEDPGWGTLPLPQGAPLNMELGHVIANRRSKRSFSGDSMTLDQIATLVRAANGVTAHATVGLMSGGEVTLPLRAIPSGGGLYPVDLYVAAFSVDGLERGVYKYDPINDQLIHVLKENALDKLRESFAVPDEVIALSSASAAFFLVAQPWRSMRKYGNRGMRFVFMEAGAMGEHINLATVSLGLGSVDCAAVYDDIANEALEIDGLYEALVHTIVIGYPG